MPTDPTPVTIVTGLPRSGTSLMMQMLEAGGLEAFTDRERAADGDNPRGYYELEAVKQLRDDTSWLDEARGRAVKVIHALAREGGWAEGGEGSTHHGVIALRRLPRARKRIEQAGCGVTWVYDRHEPAQETRDGIQRLLNDLGWELGS